MRLTQASTFGAALAASFLAASANCLFSTSAIDSGTPSAYDVRHADKVAIRLVGNGLETKLRNMVRAGDVTLAEAQKAVSTDSVAAYKKYNKQ